MGIRADMDAALDGAGKGVFRLGNSAMAAFWAEQGVCDSSPPMVNGKYVATTYRGIVVIPTDRPHGWELAAA